MKVLLNRYKGDHFEHDYTCSICHHIGTVVRLPLSTFPLICHGCLELAQDLISLAIKEDIAREQNS